MGVLVLIEHEAGGVDELSLQALSLARESAGGESLEALLVGPGGREAAGQLGALGVTRRTSPRTSVWPPTRPAPGELRGRARGPARC